MTETQSLPALPVVIAHSMLAAQGFSPTAEQRAAMIARADFFESAGMARTVYVQVRGHGGERLGDLVFNV